MKVHERSGIGIARTFQIMKPLSNMTVLDNVIAGAFFGRNRCRRYNEAKRHALEVLEFTNLIQKKNFPARSWVRRIEAPGTDTSACSQAGPSAVR
jgi:branched-chain amino acid transport system ATP-binding protein